MRFTDQLRGMRHVFASNRARTLLTLLGIMIGSGSIVLLAGLLRAGEESLSAHAQMANEADLVRVRKDEPPAKQLAKTQRPLEQGDSDALGESRLLEGAGVASERMRWDQRAIFHANKKRVTLVSTAPRTLPLYRVSLHHGRFIDDDDMRERRRVAVVGYEVWAELLESRPLADGLVVDVGGARWTVVGVLKTKPPLFGGSGGSWRWDSRVLVPQTTYDAIFDPSHRVDRIYVRLEGRGQLSRRMGAVVQVVKETILRRHLGVQNFKVMGEESFANQERLIVGVIEMLLLTTALLSLFVGGINIMNIMLVTVTERTREIGIRRAVGAAPRTILMQFLLEAGCIAMAGGLIGVAGGAGFTWLLSVLLRHVLGAWTLYIETWAILLGLGLSLSTGVVFGLFPAWRAARLDPVEALRYE